MIIDISDILSCENKEETKQVQIELASFVSKLGEFLYLGNSGPLHIFAPKHSAVEMLDFVK